MESTNKYIVKICTGTLCHVMGGAELPGLEGHLPVSLKDKVTLKGMVCAQYCKEKNRKPPFVLVNDHLIEGATIDKIIDYLQNCETNDARE